MKKILILLISIVAIGNLYSQNLISSNFEELLADTYAYDYQRVDLNDVPCAVVKVDLPSVEDLEFDGLVIDAFYDDGEYIVYVVNGAKRIRYHHSDYYPGDIVFPKPVKSLSTYHVKLESQVLENYEDEGYYWLTIKTKDSVSNVLADCCIKVDGQSYQTDTLGMALISLPRGPHELVVSHDGYMDYYKDLLVTESIPYDIVMIPNMTNDHTSNTKIKYDFSDNESQEYAWFLTDKMDHELNLTEEQVNDVYEINYDYISHIQPVGCDFEYDYNLRYRNLSFVLDEWQWNMFEATDYFLSPIYMNGNNWEFAVFQHYDHRNNYHKIPKKLTKYSGRDLVRTRGIYYQNRSALHKENLANDVSVLAFRENSFKPFTRNDLSSSSKKISASTSRTGVYRRQGTPIPAVSIQKSPSTASNYMPNNQSIRTANRKSATKRYQGNAYPQQHIGQSRDLRHNRQYVSSDPNALSRSNNQGNNYRKNRGESNTYGQNPSNTQNPNDLIYQSRKNRKTRNVDQYSEQTRTPRNQNSQNRTRISSSYRDTRDESTMIFDGTERQQRGSSQQYRGSSQQNMRSMPQRSGGQMQRSGYGSGSERQQRGSSQQYRSSSQQNMRSTPQRSGGQMQRSGYGSGSERQQRGSSQQYRGSSQQNMRSMPQRSGGQMQRSSYGSGSGRSHRR